MSSEVFRRVGRGGAGNFYSKQDVQEADKVSKEVGIEILLCDTSVNLKKIAIARHFRE